MTASETQGEEERVRGKGRGSNFFVLGRAVWAEALAATTENRLNLLCTLLVLVAGTGADQRLTKWSASACEHYLGLGKPRARRAIDELVNAGLVEITTLSRKQAPQYRLPDVSQDDDPIFLPVQLVTGFGEGASILRRVRETGDPMVLRMLVDLYGLVQVDATYGVPLKNLRQAGELPARKIAEMGVHALWSTPSEGLNTIRAGGEWCSVHRAAGEVNGGWALLWERVALLRKIGALAFEPWLFEGPDLDAEPMFPVDFAVLYSRGGIDEVAELSRTCVYVARAMTENREYLLERNANDLPVALPAHHQPPAVRGVAKLIVEPDTPGCRLGYARRKSILEERLSAYRALLEDIEAGRFDRPLGSPRYDAEETA